MERLTTSSPEPIRAASHTSWRRPKLQSQVTVPFCSLTTSCLELHTHTHTCVWCARLLCIFTDFNYPPPSFLSPPVCLFLCLAVCCAGWETGWDDVHWPVFLLHLSLPVRQYPSPLHGHRWITRPGLAPRAGAAAAPRRIHPCRRIQTHSAPALPETWWEEGGGAKVRRSRTDEETRSCCCPILTVSRRIHII